MAIDPEELEEIPPQGHVQGRLHGPGRAALGDPPRLRRPAARSTSSASGRWRACSCCPVYDPQFRRNRERVARDAEREHLILEWDLGDEPE